MGLRSGNGEGQQPSESGQIRPPMTKKGRPTRGDGEVRAAKKSSCERCNGAAGNAHPDYLTILKFVKKQTAGCVGIITCADNTSNGFKTQRKAVCFDGDGRACLVRKLDYHIRKQLLEDVGAYDVRTGELSTTPPAPQVIRREGHLPSRRGKVMRHKGHGHD